MAKPNESMGLRVTNCNLVTSFNNQPTRNCPVIVIVVSGPQRTSTVGDLACRHRTEASPQA